MLHNLQENTFGKNVDGSRRLAKVATIAGSVLKLHEAPLGVSFGVSFGVSLGFFISAAQDLVLQR